MKTLWSIAVLQSADSVRKPHEFRWQGLTVDSDLQRVVV